MNILVIDDDNDYNFLLEILLKKTDVVDDYFIFNQPGKAWDFLNDYTGRLDCIFIDIRMPRMDGFEFLHTYKKQLQKKFPDTRIYFLTSSIRKGDMKEATKLKSVEGVYTKPLTREVLQDIHQREFGKPALQGH